MSPSGLTDMLKGKDVEGARRAMQAMLQMKKIDIEKVRQAYEQG
jgi:predicted 3-demethylubiquinone-9 3-methyltransferase (glyoxalase superfamily)